MHSQSYNTNLTTCCFTVYMIQSNCKMLHYFDFLPFMMFTSNLKIKKQLILKVKHETITILMTTDPSCAMSMLIFFACPQNKYTLSNNHSYKKLRHSIKIGPLLTVHFVQLLCLSQELLSHDFCITVGTTASTQRAM